MVLKAQNLCLRLPEKGPVIFDDISLELNEGETGYVYGPSGSGKTTLGLTLCGYIPLWAGSWKLDGTIELRGKSLVQGSPTSGTDMILDNPYTQLSGLKRTVFQELAFPLECRGVRPKEMSPLIEEYAELLGITLLLSRNIRTLSGGELQRVLIAGSLITKPEFLFLDRPLTEIDMDFRPVLLEILLSRIKESGSAALISEDPWLVDKNSFDHNIFLGKEEDSDPKFIPVKVYQKRKTGSSANSPLLSVESLSFSYETGKQVVSNCSLSLDKGDIALLTGPNGSGKTTLARLIAGILTPGGGTILLNGRSIEGMEEWEIMSTVGLSLQDPGLHLCRKTVAGEIELAGKWGNAPGKFVEILGLDCLLGEHPVELSQAEKKRLGMALACGERRKVLILDEPTQYQDSEGYRRMVEAMTTLTEEGRALIIITHDPRLFRTFPDSEIIHLSKEC